MTGKARLSHLSKRLSEKRGSGPPPPGAPELVANPAHGEKGDFVKVTVTLPPAVYELIMREATRRKVAREANPQLSAVIREAVVRYLEGRAR